MSKKRISKSKIENITVRRDKIKNENKTCYDYFKVQKPKSARTKLGHANASPLVDKERSQNSEFLNERPKRLRHDSPKQNNLKNQTSSVLSIEDVQTIVAAQKSYDGGVNCNICGKLYKSKVCFIKHIWEHTSYWNIFSGAKNHERVLSIQAAIILYCGVTDQSKSTTSSDLFTLLVTSPHSSEAKNEKEEMVNSSEAKNEKEGMVNSSEAKNEKEGMVNSSEAKNEKEGMVNSSEAKNEKEGMVNSSEAKNEKEGMVNSSEAKNEKEGMVNSSEAKKEKEGMVNSLEAKNEKENIVTQSRDLLHNLLFSSNKKFSEQEVNLNIENMKPWPNKSCVTLENNSTKNLIENVVSDQIIQVLSSRIEKYCKDSLISDNVLPAPSFKLDESDNQYVSDLGSVNSSIKENCGNGSANSERRHKTMSLDRQHKIMSSEQQHKIMSSSNTSNSDKQCQVMLSDIPEMFSPSPINSGSMHQNMSFPITVNLDRQRQLLPSSSTARLDRQHQILPSPPTKSNLQLLSHFLFLQSQVSPLTSQSCQMSGPDIQLLLVPPIPVQQISPSTYEVHGNRNTHAETHGTSENNEASFVSPLKRKREGLNCTSALSRGKKKV